MLETDIKPRTIVIERRTHNGNWFEVETRTKQSGFTEEDFNEILYSDKAKDVFIGTGGAIRCRTLKGTQICSTRNRLLYNYTKTSDLFTVKYRDPDNYEDVVLSFSKNNSVFAPPAELYKLFKLFGGLDRTTQRTICKEDGYVNSCNLHFYNGTIMSIAFYEPVRRCVLY